MVKERGPQKAGLLARQLRVLSRVLGPSPPVVALLRHQAATASPARGPWFTSGLLAPVERFAEHYYRCAVWPTQGSPPQGELGRACLVIDEVAGKSRARLKRP